MITIDTSRINNTRKLVGILCYVTTTFVITLLCRILCDLIPDTDKVRVLGLLGWFVLFVFFAAYKYVTGKFITLASVFVLSMFAFGYGQYLLYGIGAKYDYYFLNSYYAGLYNNDKALLTASVQYTLIGLELFCLAIMAAVRKNRPWQTAEKPGPSVFRVDDDAMRKVFIVLFCLSAVPTIAFNAYLAVYSLAAGYAKARLIPTPAIVRYLGTFFIPSAIGSFICNKSKPRARLVVAACSAAYCAMSFIVGGRSLAMGLLFGLAVVFLSERKISVSAIVVILLGGYLFIALSSVISEARNNSGDGFIRIFMENAFGGKAFSLFLGETGFSGSSLTWMMHAMESRGVNPINGKTYIGAVIGILPSSLDVLHIQDYWNEFTQLEDFLTNYYSFDFGVGYSLFAESYYNFRWFGLVVLFLEGLLFGKLFNLDSACTGSWKKYVSIALFSMLITIPRRDIVFLSNYIALCVIAPYILIVLYATIKNSVLLNAARAKKK